MNKLSALCLALASVSLVACGGSDHDDDKKTEDTAVLQVGEQYEVLTSVDDEVVGRDVFKVYAVTEQGALTDDAAMTPIVSDWQVPVLMQQQQADASGALVNDPNTPDVAVLHAFFEALWSGIQQYYPGATPEDIAEAIVDFNLDLDAIYADYRRSGMTVVEYISFFETLDRYFEDDEDAEDQLLHWLDIAGTSHRGWLDSLQAHGQSWDSFLALMVQRGDSFEDLRANYQLNFAGLDLNGFLNQYINAQPRMQLMADESTGMAVAKLVWDIIKDNRPVQEIDGAYTTVLSKTDADGTRYAGAKRSASKIIKIQGKNLFGMTLFRAEFNLTGYYGAQHANFGGYWLPSVAYDVTDAYGLWPWKTNAGATVQNVANVGSWTTPVPELIVTAKFKFSSPLQSRYEAHNFKANGQTGITYLGKGK